jgi:hypothetical protein
MIRRMLRRPSRDFARDGGRWSPSLTLPTLLAALLAGLFACAPARAQAVDRYFPADGVRIVRLQVDEGQVYCAVSEDGEVHVKVHGQANGQLLRPMEVGLRHRTSGDTLGLALTLRRRPFLPSVSPEGQVELYVPHDTRVWVAVDDGGIEARDLDAGGRLETVDDNIRVRHCEGYMELITRDGTAWAPDLVGALRAVTRDGRIDVTGRLSGATATAGDGSLDISVTGILDPVPGGPLPGPARWSLRGEGGNLKLKLPKEFQGTIVARAPGGSLDPGPYGTPEARRFLREEGPAASLSATLGPAGGDTVRVTSATGRVTLR